MSNQSLIKKLGSWRAVCEHVANQNIEAGYNFDKDDFIEWMMLQENYSPSGYERGTFFDRGMYLYCYSVYKKLKGDHNQHHMILVSGKIGKGKSMLAAQICALCDPTFNLSRICYVPPHLFRRLSICKSGEANLIDEGGNFFKGRNAMSKLGKDISQAFQLVRDLKQLLVVCYDEPEKLDKDIIDKFDAAFVKVYNSSAKGDNQFKDYFAFSNIELENIKGLLKKKVSITNQKILRKRSWAGHNSKEFPIVNDLTDEVYRTEKRKYLRDHMKLLAEKWQKEFEDVDTQPEKVVKIEELPQVPKQKPMSLQEYSKYFGICESTATNHAKNGCKFGVWEKLGGKWRFFMDFSKTPQFLTPSRGEILPHKQVQVSKHQTS